jgi:hypothetical protein
VSVDGTAYWQIVDRDFPGCCAPLGWIPDEIAGEPVFVPHAPECPDPGQAMSALTMTLLGRLETVSCFGSMELTLRDTLACGEPIVDASYFLDGPSWAEDQVMCELYSNPEDYEQSFQVFGEAVTSLIVPGDYFLGTFEVEGHFDDESSSDCSWVPGNYIPFHDASEAPIEPAQFACRTSFLVDTAERMR